MTRLVVQVDAAPRPHLLRAAVEAGLRGAPWPPGPERAVADAVAGAVAGAVVAAAPSRAGAPPAEAVPPCR
jgi:hypothetical protein